MTVKEAARKAEEFRSGCHAFLAKDCGDRWAIFFEEDRGHLGGFPVFVFKDDGYCTGFIYAEYLDLMHGGKIIELND